MELEEFTTMLSKILETSREMFGIACIDASDFDEVLKRVRFR